MNTASVRVGVRGLLGLAALALFAAAALLSLSPAQAQQIQVAPATVTLSDPLGSTALWNYFYVEARVQIGQLEECSGDAEVVTRRFVENDDQDGDGTVREDEKYWVENRDGTCKEGREDEAVITPIYADGATVTWGTTPADQTAVRRVTSLTSDTDSNGRAWAVFRVLAEGNAEITATTTVSPRPEASGSLDVSVGQTASSSPPEAGQIWLVSAPDQRRAADRFTVSALVTDINGAAVPDGTPVTWRAIGFADAGSQPAALESEIWQAGAVERSTNNGIVEASYTRISGNANNNVLVIASAGDASGAVYMETGLTAATGTDTAAIELERATGQEPWQLFDPDDTSSIALNAKLTDPDGDPVPDGMTVYWDLGGVPSTAGQTVLSSTNPEVTFSTTTTSGGGDPAGKATYTVDLDGAGQGYVIARSGSSRTVSRFIPFPPPGRLIQQTIRTRLEHPIDIAWFNIGEYAAPPGNLAFSLRLAGDSDNIVSAGSTARIGGLLTFSGQGDGLGQVLHVTGGTLRIAGSYEWEDSRRNTYANVPSATARSRAALLREQAPLGRGLIGGSASDWQTAGECTGSSDGGTQWTCAIDLGDSEIVIPAGAPAGTFAVSGVLTVNGREFRSAAYEIEVVAPGSFNEVAEVQFDFPEQAGGAPWPSTIAAGQSTRLRLKSLTEKGGPSPAGSINTVFVTTSAGSLSTNIGGGCIGGGGLTCEISGSAINAANADKLDVTLTHPGRGKSGVATVTATVVTLGEDFVPPARSVTFLGEAVSMAISSPATGLLSSATSGAGDNRDVLKLTVSAVDNAGNSAAVPYRNPRASIKGPDSKTVTSGIALVWTEDGDDPDTTHDRFTRNSANAVEVTITTTADSLTPLKTGDYTLELRTADQKAEQTFSVVGGVASMAIAAPQEAPQIGGQLTLSVTALDAAGMPAPDGTSIDWSASDGGPTTALVALTESSSTTDGEATGRFFVVGEGTAIVTATADGVRDIELVTVAGDGAAAAGAAGAAADLSGDLSTTDTDTVSVWFGGEMLVSTILNGLSGTGVTSIRVWSSPNWIFYGVADGMLIPGSTDITVTTGSVLWLGR